MRSFSRGRAGRGDFVGLKEVVAEANGFRMDLDEGVIGIHDVETLTTGEIATVYGDDAIVIAGEEWSEKRDGGAAAHDNHGFHGIRQHG